MSNQNGSKLEQLNEEESAYPSNSNKRHHKRSHQDIMEPSSSNFPGTIRNAVSLNDLNQDNDLNPELESPRKAQKYKRNSLQLILPASHYSSQSPFFNTRSFEENNVEPVPSSSRTYPSSLQVARPPIKRSVSSNSGVLASLYSLRNSKKPDSAGLIPYRDWKVILRSRNPSQVVLYNRQNHELTVTSGRNSESMMQEDPLICQLCHQRMPLRYEEPSSEPDTKEPDSVSVDTDTAEIDLEQDYTDDDKSLGGNGTNLNFMDKNYFRCLALSHSQLSKQRLLVDQSPSAPEETALPKQTSDHLSQDCFNQGYYNKFFKETKKLGKGAKGNVFLCQHVLEDIELGRYAVKKVAIGNNHTWLARMLKEVHMLERLRHPNIIDYKHAWLENYQPNLFAPVVPCLFILMECANGGNLEEYVQRRSFHFNPDASDLDRMTPKERALFLRQQNALKKDNIKNGTTSDESANKFLSLREILSLFLDICHGLSHLHRYSIVHRDIKPPNLLLSFKDINDPREIPTVLISDFGECEDANKLSHPIGRTGATGTLEFMAPELLQMDASGQFFGEHSPKADMWSLGMVLYYLCYSRLPYAQIDDIDFLRDEILDFHGPIKFPDDSQASPRIPGQFKRLISLLLSRDPQLRPSVDEILANARDVDFQTLIPGHYYPNSFDSLDKGSVSSPKDSRTLVARKNSLPLHSESSLKFSSVSISDKLSTTTNSPVHQPSSSKVDQIDSPLISSPITRATTQYPHLNALLIGLKMASILIPCYPISAHLAASLPLTSLAIWGLYSDDPYTQWCLLAIHVSFLTFLLFAFGSICGS